MTVRSVHPDEERAVRKALSYFGVSVEGFAGGGELRVVEREGERVLVSVPKEALRVAAPREPLHLGRGLGSFQGKEFRLDIEGVLALGEAAAGHSVRIAEKGEQLFLYGRDLFGPSLLRHDRDLRVGSLCLVRNARGECIGLGRVQGEWRSEGTVVKNLLDLGSYLRVPEE